MRQRRLRGRVTETTPISPSVKNRAYGAITFRAKTICSFCFATKRGRGRRNIGKTDLRFHYNRVKIGGNETALDTLDQISGIVRELEIPREAMGRGDLKFLAAIGAFLGWRAVLFSVFAGSLLGSFVGILTLVIGQRVWSAKLPFGPYLAFGALGWMFFGESLLRWYTGLLNP